MIKTVENLAGGKYEWYPSPVEIGEKEIDTVTFIGENYEGRIHIAAADGHRIRGRILSDDPRIVPERDLFSGTDVTLVFGVDVTGLEEGGSVQGNLQLVTSAGEFTIPVRVRIKAEVVDTSLGTIGTLDDFALLAEESYEEAFRIFRRNGFEAMLDGEDAQYRTLCRALKASPLTPLRLEEFLISAGRKEKVTFSAAEKEFVFDNVRESRKETVSIRRSTWGALRAEGRTEGDFLKVSRRVISDEDFVGSSYELEYILLAEEIGSEPVTGRIIVKSLYDELVFSVTASDGGEITVNRGAVLAEADTALREAYTGWRCGSMEEREFTAGALKALGTIKKYGTNPELAGLLEVFVYFTNGDLREAGRLLTLLREKGLPARDAEVQAMNLYLGDCLRMKNPGSGDTAALIERCYRQNRESLLLLLLRFATDDSIRRMPYSRMNMLAEAYDNGERSDVLFAEAFLLLRENDAMLTRITDFFRSVLVFAVDKKLITKELALRAAYLSDNERTCEEGMYHILSRCYEYYPLDGILEAVCRLIMKGNPRSEQYHSWYALAVDHELRITRLFEYYIETMPENSRKLLPLPIRKYFAFNDTLSHRKRSVVYANIIRNKEEDPETYAAYAKKAEAFTREALLARKISRDYAVLYAEFLHEIDTREEAEALSELVFTERLYTDDPEIRTAVVVHGELKEEERYPVVRGEAHIRRYTEDAQLIFEDAQKRRVLSTVSYSIEPLLAEEEYCSICRSFGVLNTGIMLHTVRNADHVSVRNLEVFQAVSKSEAFVESYRQNCSRMLLTYFAENASVDSLDDYLENLDLSHFAASGKARLAEILIERGKFETAFSILSRYGFENVRITPLLRLASRMITIRKEEEDEEVELLAAYVFRLGKYDETILRYLTACSRGTLRELLDIREKAKGFALEIHSLNERILIQEMYVHEFLPESPEILREYVRGAGSRKVILAFLTFASIAYLMSEGPVDPYIAGLLSAMYDKGEELDPVLRLALLMYLADESGLSAHEEEQADQLLAGLVRKGLRFRYFQKLPKSFLRQYQLEDRVFVEQRAAVSDSVTLYYRLSSDPDSAEEYRMEPLPRRYRGVFGREFTLFYGEILTYYITVRHNGKEERTAERSITTPFVDMKGRSRYQLINQMLLAEKNRDDEALEEKMHEYLLAVGTVDGLFELEEI